ncbi:hypothetical protein RSAG8_13462, partial [Rhizoctonia solani AG-8 WAC10335]
MTDVNSIRDSPVSDRPSCPVEELEPKQGGYSGCTRVQVEYEDHLSLGDALAALVTSKRRLVGLINTMKWIENITAGISNKLEWLVTDSNFQRLDNASDIIHTPLRPRIKIWHHGPTRMPSIIRTRHRRQSSITRNYIILSPPPSPSLYHEPLTRNMVCYGEDDIPPCLEFTTRASSTHDFTRLDDLRHTSLHRLRRCEQQKI